AGRRRDRAVGSGRPRLVAPLACTCVAVTRRPVPEGWTGGVAGDIYLPRRVAVMQLHIHLPQRLLHVLDVRSRVVEEPLPDAGGRSRLPGRSTLSLREFLLQQGGANRARRFDNTLSARLDFFLPAPTPA